MTFKDFHALNAVYLPQTANLLYTSRNLTLASNSPRRGCLCLSGWIHENSLAFVPPLLSVMLLMY